MRDEIKDLADNADTDGMESKRTFYKSALIFLGAPAITIIAVVTYSYFNPDYHQNDQHDLLVSNIKKTREISSNVKP